MTSLTLTQRLKIFIGIVIVIIFLGGILVSSYFIVQLNQIHQLQQQISTIGEISDIIQHLQIERKISNNFIENQKINFTKELQLHRINTNVLLSKTNHKLFSINELHKLTQIRHDIDNKRFSSTESFDRYTALISEIRSSYLVQVKTVHHYELQAYTNLIALREAMEQIRYTMGSILLKRSFDHSLFIRISHAKAAFDVARAQLYSVSTPEFNN